jgi:hypothetical protein
MNDELQKQLAALLSSLMTVANDGTTWAKGEIPQLVQEQVVFARMEETFYVFLCVVGFVGFSLLMVRLVRLSMDRKTEYGLRDLYGLCSCFSGVVVLVAAVFLLFNIHPMLQVWFAPRLYIVEWLHGMVKS